MIPHLIWAVVILSIAGMALFAFSSRQASVENLSIKLDNQVARVAAFELRLNTVQAAATKHDQQLSFLNNSPTKIRQY